MALKAKKPEIKKTKLKMFVFGSAGIGKTTASIQFPNSYIIDTERGTEHYPETINKSNSVVLQSLDVDEIKAELKELLTTKHEYKTLIIDPMTKIYESVQDKWNRIFSKHAKTAKEAEVQDFGMRYWGKVKSDYKSIQRLILALDMNVIVTAHQKIMYGAGMTKIGDTFDSMKGDDYFFDYIFQLVIKGGKRIAKTIKERSEIGQQKFPPEFEWSYENFVKYYGSIIREESKPLELASKEDVERLTNLLNTLNVKEEISDKWLVKAEVENFEDMPKVKIAKCLKYCETQLEKITKKQEIK